jgi:hypothetical protein
MHQVCKDTCDTRCSLFKSYVSWVDKTFPAGSEEEAELEWDVPAVVSSTRGLML